MKHCRNAGRRQLTAHSFATDPAWQSTCSLASIGSAARHALALAGSGLDVAVISLKKVFDDAGQQIPDVVAVVKTAGMLCVRHKRNNPSSFSDHSWWTAIDLFFGTDVVPEGKPRTYCGCPQSARPPSSISTDGIGAPDFTAVRWTACISSFPRKHLSGRWASERYQLSFV